MRLNGVIARTVGCLVLLLVAESHARAQETKKAVQPKQDFVRFTYRQETRHPSFGAGFALYSLASDGSVKVRCENLAGRNNELCFQLTDAEMAEVREAYAAADEKRFLPKKDAERPEGLGPFSFGIDRADRSHHDMQGELAEFPGLGPLLKLVSRVPAGRVDEKALAATAVITLTQTGPGPGGEADPWHLDVSVMPDGTFTGSYRNVDGTPSGRRQGTVRGKLSKDELSALGDEVGKSLENKPKKATEGTSFALRVTSGPCSMWVSGHLADHPDMLPLVKKVGAFAAAFDAEVKPFERAGLAAPSIPREIADRYDGFVEPRPAGAVVARAPGPAAPPSVPHTAKPGSTAATDKPTGVAVAIGKR